MSVITLKELLEAGVHFGHKTQKWNPKMKKYIFGERQGIFIIDLQKTMAEFEKAYQYLKEAAANGKNILFVGTKKQAQSIIAEESERCKISYVDKRWLGGTLTNFGIIKNSIKQLKEFKDKEEKGEFSGLSKKALAQINKEKARLEKSFGGIRNMDERPDIILIIDPVKEKTALTEARKVGIFTIGIIDTNGDPDLLDLCIPGNDDAIRSIKLLVNRIADAIIEGKESISERIEEAVEESRDKEEVLTAQPELGKKSAAKKRGVKKG